MRSAVTTLAWTIALLGTSAGPAIAQDTCEEDEVSTTEAVEAVHTLANTVTDSLENLRGTLLEDLNRGEFTVFDLDSIARKSPSGHQVGAPSASPTSTTLVDGASFPGLLGLAFENGLVTGDDGAYTIAVNPFAFVALFRPEALDRQSLYSQYDHLRRFSGAVTLGGDGESIDRDGDGELDDPLEADGLDGNVLWDLRWRILGSRDRRDDVNFQKVRTRTRDHLPRAGGIFSELTTVFAQRSSAWQGSARSCLIADSLAGFLQSKRFDRLAGANRDLRNAIDAAVEEIDTSLVVTLAFIGKERPSELGRDERGLALRVDRGSAKRSHGFNLEWREREGRAGAAEETVIEVAYGYSAQWAPPGWAGGEMIVLTFAGAFEWFDNVPDAEHDTMAKANLKVDLPLADGLIVPISFTWVNHENLRSDEDILVGAVGLTVDFSVGELIGIGR